MKSSLHTDLGSKSVKISSAIFLMELEFRNIGSFLRPRNALRCIECRYFFRPINEMELKLKGGKLECPEPLGATTNTDRDKPNAHIAPGLSN